MLAFLSLVIMVGGGFLFYLSKMMPQFQTKGFRTLSVFLMILGLFGIFKPFEIVPVGHKGVIVTLGNASDKSVDPGLAFKFPIVQDIKLITIQPIQLDAVIEVGPQGAITKDNQTIGARLTFFYIYDPHKIPEMYKQYGEEKLKSLVLKSSEESFKAEIGKYDIFNLPIKQDTIRLSVLSQIREKLSIYPIELTEFKITNYDWSDAFDKQIQATMEQAQKVRQMEQDLLVTEKSAQKQVKEAQAQKEALITKAEGEKAAAILNAEAKAAEGEGIRKYNESVQRNMALEIEIRKLEIEKIKAEKWNGQYVPTNNYGPIPVQTGRIQPE